MKVLASLKKYFQNEFHVFKLSIIGYPVVSEKIIFEICLQKIVADVL